MVPARTGIERTVRWVPDVHSNRNEAVDGAGDRGQANPAPVARRIRQRIGQSGCTIGQQSGKSNRDDRKHQHPGKRRRLVAQRKVGQKNIQKKFDDDERQRQRGEEKRRTAPKELLNHPPIRFGEWRFGFRYFATSRKRWRVGD